MYLPSPESRDISLNNNVNEVDRLQFNLETKVDVNFKLSKSDNEYFCNTSQIDDYRSQTHSSYGDNFAEYKIFYSPSDDTQQHFNDSFNDFKLHYRSSEPRIQEKNDVVFFDLPATYDYSTNNYDDKVIELNETIGAVSDIDYSRLQYPTGHYSENFENMTTNQV